MRTSWVGMAKVPDQTGSSQWQVASLSAEEQEETGLEVSFGEIPANQKIRQPEREDFISMRPKEMGKVLGGCTFCVAWKEGKSVAVAMQKEGTGQPRHSSTPALQHQAPGPQHHLRAHATPASLILGPV